MGKEKTKQRKKKTKPGRKEVYKKEKIGNSLSNKTNSHWYLYIDEINDSHDSILKHPRRSLYYI
jgi:hypothetical protein